MGKGAEYEIFVKTLFTALHESEANKGHHNIVIEQNKKLKDQYGVDREFDLYWEYELLGFTHKVVIECKNYNSNISLEKIDAFKNKIQSIPTNLKGVFATKVGYQSGILQQLKDDTIDLLIVREQTNDDWRDHNGNPYLRTLIIKIEARMPAQITDIIPDFDDDWMKKNTDIKKGDIISINASTDLIFIRDKDRNERYSFYDLQNRLTTQHASDHGIFKKTLSFDDARLEWDTSSYKILSLHVTYEISPPATETVKIDGSAMLRGVIEYLNRAEKKLIFNHAVHTRPLKPPKSG